MGILRIILVLGVLLEHSDYPIFVGSHTAVQIFFIISGFYMTLIYGTRYQSPLPFYASRAFRLLPAYWVAFIICLLYSEIGSLFGLTTVIDYWQRNISFYTSYDWLVYTLSNLFILGSDLVWFMPAAHLTQVSHPVHLFVILPIWTVSVEILFYLLCPLFARYSTRTLIYMIIFVLLIRILSYIFWGMDSPPYHARFAPFEMMFFLIGMLSARLYFAYQTRILQIWEKYCFRICCLLGIYYAIIIKFYFLTQYMPQIMIYKMNTAILSISIYLLTIIALPVIFTISKNWRWDREIGELSYPIYLMHYIFVILFHHNKPFPEMNNEYTTLLIVFLSVIHGWAIYRWVQRPVDRYRMSHFVSSSP